MEKKESYILGILGGLIGGIISTIPWILLYVYGDMMFSLLAVFIAMGAFRGYKLFKGKMNKKLPVTITIISLISVTIATLIIIPLLLLAQNGMTPSLDNLEYLYQYSDFKAAILKDYFIAFFFTLLGISSVIAELKKGNYSDIHVFNLNNQNFKVDIAVYKEVFRKLGAMNKGTAVSKDIVLNELSSLENAEFGFKQLSTQQIIRKYKNNYYFDERCENSSFYRFLVIYLKIMKWIILIGLLLFFIIILFV